MQTLIRAMIVAGTVIALIVVFNLFGAMVIYAGWNWGLVGAVSWVNSMSLSQAFWLGLLPASIVVTVRKSD